MLVRLIPGWLILGWLILGRLILGRLILGWLILGRPSLRPRASAEAGSGGGAEGRHRTIVTDRPGTGLAGRLVAARPVLARLAAGGAMLGCPGLACPGLALGLGGRPANDQPAGAGHGRPPGDRRGIPGAQRPDRAPVTRGRLPGDDEALPPLTPLPPLAPRAPLPPSLSPLSPLPPPLPRRA